jgi:Ubiquitin carboxyl-terminal hydrolase
MICSGKKRDSGVKDGPTGNTNNVANPESEAASVEGAAETVDMKRTLDKSHDVFSDSQSRTDHGLPIVPPSFVIIIENKERKDLPDIRNNSPSPSKAGTGVVTQTILPNISQHSCSPASNETSTHKGLSNHAGENNCFLNVAIQTLWHLGPFRYEMQKRIASRNNANNGGTENAETEMMESLCSLFVQYEHTDLSSIPSTELRKTLSGLFNECRLGEIADANETLEAILERIHQECTPMCPHGPHKCLAHNVFGGLLLEQATCRSCGASSVPKMRNDFMHYVYAAEMITLNEKRRPGPDMLRSRFGNLLHECMEVSFRSCPSQDCDHFKGRIFSSGANSPNSPNGGRSGAMTPNPMMEGKYTDKDILRAMESEFSRRDDHIILTDTTSALHSAVHSQVHSPIMSRKPSIVTPAEIECKCAAEVRVQAVEPPNVLAISVAWTSAKQSVGTLRSFLSLMSNTIQLADLFDVNEKSPSSNPSACNSPSRKSSLAASLSNALSSASKRASINSPSSKGSVTSPGRKDSANSPGRKPYANSPGRKGSVNSPSRGKKVFPLGDDATGPSYTFRGFVCYYGSHYVSIFQVNCFIGSWSACLLLCRILSHPILSPDCTSVLSAGIIPRWGFNATLPHCSTLNRCLSLSTLLFLDLFLGPVHAGKCPIPAL